MTSWECYENKWFYMKYIGKMAETESLLSTFCTVKNGMNVFTSGIALVGWWTLTLPAGTGQWCWLDVELVVCRGGSRGGGGGGRTRRAPPP